eukprot:scaffold433_cov151-Alexandrium_tamarense.AAC.2
MKTSIASLVLFLSLASADEVAPERLRIKRGLNTRGTRRALKADDAELSISMSMAAVPVPDFSQWDEGDFGFVNDMSMSVPASSLEALSAFTSSLEKIDSFDDLDDMGCDFWAKVLDDAKAVMNGTIVNTDFTLTEEDTDKVRRLQALSDRGGKPRNRLLTFVFTSHSRPFFSSLSSNGKRLSLTCDGSVASPSAVESVGAEVSFGHHQHHGHRSKSGKDDYTLTQVQFSWSMDNISTGKAIFLAADLSELLITGTLKDEGMEVAYLPKGEYVAIVIDKAFFPSPNSDKIGFCCNKGFYSLSSGGIKIVNPDSDDALIKHVPVKNIRYGGEFSNVIPILFVGWTEVFAFKIK